MAKLTKSFIDQLPIPPKGENGKATQVIYRDSALSGFGVLVGSGGTKSFFIERRVNGRVKRISIGRYGHLTPSQARDRAQELLGNIAVGKDPHHEKRSMLGRSITLGQAFQDYLHVRKDLKPGTILNYQKCLKTYVPDWLNKRLIDITKDKVEERHRKIGERTPSKANNTMRVLRAIFNHAIAKFEDGNGQAILLVNPVDRISHVRAWYRIERKRTILEPHELASWYQATETVSHDVTRDYLRFLLFTGLRKMEAATLRWEQVSLEAKTIKIPDTKNRDPHTLPLTDYLMKLLKARKSGASGSPWVFPSPVSDGHLKEPRGAVAQIVKVTGRSFALHDLRRTFITIAESLDIPAYALKQLLNHRQTNDVTAGYIVSGVERIRSPMTKISNFILNRVKENSDG